MADWLSRNSDCSQHPPMVASTARNQSPAAASERKLARLAGLISISLALLVATVLGVGGERTAFATGLTTLLAHALLFLAGLLLLQRTVGREVWRWLAVGGVLCAAGGLLALLPALAGAPRQVLTYLHVGVGAATIAGALWASLGHQRRWVSGIPVLITLLLLGGYTYREQLWATWQPPRYSSEACYRFLTATTPDQSGEPLFPSALRVSGGGSSGCQNSGCHAQVHQRASTHAHASAGSSPAYTRTLADFVQRRGAQAGRWCRGCHAPEATVVDEQAAGVNGASVMAGLTCTSCHRVDAVHALYGSAALHLRKAADGERRPWQVSLRPKEHAAQHVRPSLFRSAEFCGACHRKNWNLPQNGYHWMPGPDEFGQWQTSRYAPAALFASGERVPSRSCLGCHDAHGGNTRPKEPSKPALQLALFLRSGPAGRLVQRIQEAPAARAGEPLQLDVVVRNEGIGHDFPTGMPDLQESWLEVTLQDRAGRTRLVSGRVTPGSPLTNAHSYRLVARDRDQRPVLHGNLDEMVSVAEWRRIPSGSADVARFSFRAPAGGIGSVRVRLLRRRRPNFNRWVGVAIQQEPEVLVQVESGPSSPGAQPVGQGESWRCYGLALAGVKAYPEALQALTRALQSQPGDVETLLALGRVYLDDGDLLAAREQFRQAGSGDPERAHAWEGAVLRRMGQPDEAAALLEPLVRRFPRDLRLRFELGSAYLAALRNADAARQFEAMLDVDPIDVSAHYNLMLCLQRLNRLTDARREETIYRLLRREPSRAPEAVTSLEDRPLHLHALELVR